MENYSRRNKISTTKEEKTPTRHHIKKGLSAFQKTLATIGSILGIITATITIMTFMNNNNKSGNKPKSSQRRQQSKNRRLMTRIRLVKVKQKQVVLVLTLNSPAIHQVILVLAKLVQVIIVMARIQQHHQVLAIKKNGSVTTTIRPMSRSCSSFRFFLD